MIRVLTALAQGLFTVAMIFGVVLTLITLSFGPFAGYLLGIDLFGMPDWVYIPMGLFFWALLGVLLNWGEGFDP